MTIDESQGESTPVRDFSEDSRVKGNDEVGAYYHVLHKVFARIEGTKRSAAEVACGESMRILRRGTDDPNVRLIVIRGLERRVYQGNVQYERCPGDLRPGWES
jgi:hypothetical protein